MKPVRSILLAIATACSVSATASAATVVSNLSKPPGSGLTVISGFASAQAFSTPTSGPGWILESLTFALREQTTTDAPLTVALYSDASGNPGSLLATLTGTNPSGTDYANYAFTPTVGFTLAPNTTYFAVLSTTSSESYLWQERNSTEDGDPGWSIADVSRRSVLTGPPPFDGSALSLAVNATAVPEPSAAFLSLAALGSLLVRRRR